MFNWAPRDPIRRRRARLALHGGMALIVLLLLLAIWISERPPPFLADVSWFYKDYESHPDVELLQRYVRTDTSSATGSEIAGAELLAAELTAVGIHPEIERLGERGANLWAVLEGDTREALVLHHHIDVSDVPNPEEWTAPPFAGEIRRPWIYGRGTFDMKSVAVAQLRAFLAIAARGRRPARSLILLATGSEENGSELGTRWMLARHPELVRRFGTVLTEGGVVEAVTQTDIKYWGIEFAQRRFAQGWACASDPAALEQFASAILGYHGTGGVRPRLGIEARAFFSAYAESRTHPVFRQLLERPWQPIANGSGFRQLPSYLRSLYQSEVFPFPPEPTASGGYQMRVVVHLLPGASFEETLARLLPPWLTHGVTLLMEPPLGADTGSPVDHPVFQAATSAVHADYPEALVGPYMLPWTATDARFFREAGIPTYGFSPFVFFASDTFRVDRRNERIDLPGFLQGVRLYERLVELMVDLPLSR